ncbi:MAG: hypothetical protein WC119_08955 [Synergistaceae bacterium]
MRTTPKITIALEGNTWSDILREMSIIQECARRASSAPRIEDLPERTNIAKDCRKCHRESLAELASILKGGYGLGPDEVYDILERVR